MIQILYGTGSAYVVDPVHGVNLGTGDHEARAKALASVTANSNCGPVNVAGIQKPGLDTLTYWGHGNAAKFCDMTAAEFVDNVAAWKKWNPTLKTVEILTCNARHATDDNSYTSQVKPALKRKFSDITLKAMPMGMGSIAAHNWSILNAHVGTKTWYYVTAGGNQDTDEMWPAVHLVNAAAGTFGNNLVQAAQQVEKDNPTRKFGLKYGTFAQLRGTLTAIL